MESINSVLSPQETQGFCVQATGVAPQVDRPNAIAGSSQKRRYGKPARARSGRRARRCAMQQAGSEEDRRTLLRVLPADFIELDEGFHALTVKLAAAARARDQQLVGRYVGDLVEACGNCHSRFATARFPTFETSH